MSREQGQDRADTTGREPTYQEMSEEMCESLRIILTRLEKLEGHGENPSPNAGHTPVMLPGLGTSLREATNLSQNISKRVENLVLRIGQL